MIEVTYEGFKEWLKAKEPVAFVGLTRSPCNCPLARYLNGLTGQECSVYDNRFYMYPLNEYQNLQDWMRAFIKKVDGYSEYGYSIAAEYALKCLLKVQP